MARWPGHIAAGSVSNEIISHQDWLPTLVAAAGVADVKEKLRKGYKAGKTTFKVHLDGYNFLPYLEGKEENGPRREFVYFNDDGALVALRYNQWKLVFAEQRALSLEVWQDPFVTLRLPKLFNLRADPFERADHEGIDYERWRLDRVFLLVPAQAYVANFLQSFKDFPPRQKPASFNLVQVLQQLQTGGAGAN
jgi:arylsulfatase